MISFTAFVSSIQKLDNYYHGEPECRSNTIIIIILLHNGQENTLFLKLEHFKGIALKRSHYDVPFLLC